MGLPVVEDLGSGLLQSLGGPGGPTVAEVMRTGVDLACFSGDKLLGGPQAGLIVGRRELVAKLRAHPLYRALRLDKLSLAALEATLLMYREGRADQVPLRRMMDASETACRLRAERIAAQLPGAVVEAGAALPGGGAMPGRSLPGSIVVLRISGAAKMARTLREGRPAVLVRVSKDAVMVDPRAVGEDQEVSMIKALKAALAAVESER
jgi:L-seryl-tRNA(Ser) seleniumtransferase